MFLHRYVAGQCHVQPSTSFVFVVSKQKVNYPAGHPALPHTPRAAAAFLRLHQPSRSRLNSRSLKMLLSSVVAPPKLLLQFCISTLCSVWSSILSKILFWTMTVSPAVSRLDPSESQAASTPASVNYHFTRKCNYKCGFCFHTAKTSFVLPLDEAKRGLRLLKESGKFDGRVRFLLGRSIRNIVQ